MRFLASLDRHHWHCSFASINSLESASKKEQEATKGRITGAFDGENRWVTADSPAKTARTRTKSILRVGENHRVIRTLLWGAKIPRAKGIKRWMKRKRGRGRGGREREGHGHEQGRARDSPSLLLKCMVYTVKEDNGSTNFSVLGAIFLFHFPFYFVERDNVHKADAACT